MEKLLSSIFEPETSSLTQKIKNLFLVLAVNLVYLAFLVNFLNLFIPLEFNREEIHNPGAVFFFAVIVAPIIEEILFRVFPYKLSQVLDPENKYNMRLVMILFSSILFGMAHGGMGVLIQGFGGLCLWYIYMKNGSIGWSMLSHAIWNSFILFGISSL